MYDFQEFNLVLFLHLEIIMANRDIQGDPKVTPYSKTKMVCF